MITEAVILAGGFGTRLSHVLGNVPKPLAPVAGRPFLSYLLMRLASAGINHVVLATGYMHEVVEQYFGEEWGGLKISYSEEKEPLFTGGAILMAASETKGDDFLVLNGDTLFDIDLTALADFHIENESVLTVALRKVEDTGRYGAVETIGTIICTFREKDVSAGEGTINGGIYVINKHWLLSENLPRKFSFEKQVLQAKAQDGIFKAVSFNDYFVDIGVPDDYRKAQCELPALFLKDRYLFLDRDGVLNRQIVGDYVRNWEQWQWQDGALEALAVLSRHFDRIFIVSNQQGVGKGLFTEEALADIHTNMLSDIEAAGGRIDKVYVCTDLADSGSCMRKPAIGMALSAIADYPEVDMARSVMVGDSVTDMQFGYNAGMRCVYLTNNNPSPVEVKDYTDVMLSNLYELTELLHLS